MMMSNSTAAMWSAVGTVVVIGGGYWLCCGMGIAMLAVGGSNSESMIALAVIPCMPFLFIFPNLMTDSSNFHDDMGIALLVAWVLGKPLGLSNGGLYRLHVTTEEQTVPSEQTAPPHVRCAAAKRMQLSCITASQSVGVDP